MSTCRDCGRRVPTADLAEHAAYCGLTPADIATIPGLPTPTERAHYTGPDTCREDTRS